MSDDAKVPLPVPDDRNEWSAPLWDEDSLRAYGYARERAARAAERDSISMELALIPNAYRRPDMAHAYSRGVNDCRERIVDRGLRARAEGGGEGGR